MGGQWRGPNWRRHLHATLGPVQESSKDTTWIAVAAGLYHTAAIKADGSLWGWGNNGYGQLGDGTASTRNVPVQEATHATTWIAVAAGAYHTVAVKADGTLWAWGYNYYGQLGTGSSDSSQHSTPVQITSAGNGWVSVAAVYHTVAVKSDGTLWAWGYNYYGQLGVNDNIQKNSPQPIGTDKTWISVAGGLYHTAAVKSDGTAWAWGYNGFGQLGDGTTIQRTGPVQIGAANHWASIAVGGNTTLGKQVSDGTKTVYAKFRDTAGNWSSPVSNTIILDGTAPSGSVAVHGGSAYTRNQMVDLDISCSDNLSGCSKMQFKNESGTWSVLEPVRRDQNRMGLIGGRGDKNRIHAVRRYRRQHVIRGQLYGDLRYFATQRADRNGDDPDEQHEADVDVDLRPERRERDIPFQLQFLHDAAHLERDYDQLYPGSGTHGRFLHVICGGAG